MFTSIDAVQHAFARHDYIADRPLALTVKLAADLQKPICARARESIKGKGEYEGRVYTIPCLIVSRRKHCVSGTLELRW